jgi:hypothetical protein
MGGGRPLGLGLLGAGAGIVLLMLVWLFVSGAQGGGIVLGLLLMLVLGGPLIGAGAYVLSQQSREQRQAVAFATQRRIIDSDRLFRAEMGGTLRSLADNPALPGPQLRALADDVQSPTHTSAEWQTNIQLDDAQVGTLRRYDDLVRERVRRLRDDPSGNGSDAALRELRQAIDQREDLLLRGRTAPVLDASTLMRTEAPRTTDLQSIALGDAVSRDRVNYVVESVATYFAEGQTWKLARLVPTSPQDTPRWLYVGPGGLDVAILDESNEQPPTHRPDATGSAVVDVNSSSGTARGVLVTYSRWSEDSRIVLSEIWPNTVSHAYAGTRVKTDDLEVWPANAPLPSA